MKNVLKLVSVMLLVASSAFAADSITEARYNEAVYLPNCGGVVQTQCSDEGRCFVNIVGSSCKGVRMYDQLVSYIDGNGDFTKYFRKGRASDVSEMSGYAGNYSSTYGQLEIDPDKVKATSYATRWLYGSDYNYYVTLFVYRTDQATPYDKVILWLYKRPSNY